MTENKVLTASLILILYFTASYSWPPCRIINLSIIKFVASSHQSIYEIKTLQWSIDLDDYFKIDVGMH